MKITNKKRFTIACTVAGVVALSLTVSCLNAFTTKEETFKVNDYISTSLESELKEAYNLTSEDIENGLETFIAKHHDWEEQIQKESWLISWFAPSTEAMNEFYENYR